MKRLLVLLVGLAFLLTSCNLATTTTSTSGTTTTTTTTISIPSYSVVFISDGGSVIPTQSVNENGVATLPQVPLKEGFVFVYWYLDNSNNAYNFATAVTRNITLTALWTEVIYGLTDADKINADIEDIQSNLYLTDYSLNLISRGKVYNSRITWKSDSLYISDSGIILPVPLGEEATSAQITGTFVLNGVTISHPFDIPLSHAQPVELTNERNVLFTNLTTEYTVPDGSVNLYFEDDGYVPYIKLVDFFALLEGFIDPSVEFTFTEGEDFLEIFYQYYDEDFDETYDLTLTVNATENTISTNDPGFYWAYVYTTETNYGRHIQYDTENPDNYYNEGNDVVYDLDNYGMDIVVYDNDIVLPYYVVNQLFAGSSYYNVYYNYDKLYGIYALPASGTSEYRTIKRSTMNNTDIPADLLVHTFNMLAFDLDYFYGLKDIMGVETYYDLLFSQIDDLLQTDPEDFEYAIRDLLLISIDEPHTSYGYPSYFNSTIWSGPETNQLAFYGTRFTQWYYAGFVAVDDVIEAKWGRGGISSSAWAATSPNRPNYWFLDADSVMLILDDFNTADIEESLSYDSALVVNVLEVDDASTVLPEIAGGSKFFNYNNSSDTNVILQILVKGLNADYVSTYGDALVAMGYTKYIEATTDAFKENGYFVLTIPGEPIKNYMVQVAFDDEMNLFSIWVIDKIPTDFTSTWPLTVDTFDLVYSDSAVYLEMMMDQILELAPGLTDIILDLSWNTGGNVGALYRIVGFITDQPFRVSGVDRATGGSSSNYVLIDGTPTYPDLNWALLTTPVTFSAANEMATIFKENELGVIIGVQSGGGACSITPILLPNGTAFTMSSVNINAYRTGAGTEEDPYVFHNNEFGIEPDYIIAIGSIYNKTELLSILETANLPS